MISICIPFIRPQNMLSLINKIRKNSGIADIEILAEEDKDRIGCPKMLKKLVDKSKGDYICFIGDDTDPQKDFLLNAFIDVYYFTNESGLVGLNDKTGRTLPTHWLASRDMLDSLGGEFFHTGYQHCFCDRELMDRAIEQNKFYYSPSSIVLHNHPLLDTNVEPDKDYKRVYSKEVFNSDRSLYYKRKRNGWV